MSDGARMLVRESLQPGLLGRAARRLAIPALVLLAVASAIVLPSGDRADTPATPTQPAPPEAPSDDGDAPPTVPDGTGGAGPVVIDDGTIPVDVVTPEVHDGPVTVPTVSVVQPPPTVSVVQPPPPISIFQPPQPVP